MEIPALVENVIFMALFLCDIQFTLQVRSPVSCLNMAVIKDIKKIPGSPVLPPHYYYILKGNKRFFEQFYRRTTFGWREPYN